MVLILVGVGVLVPLVMSFNGSGICIFCSASIVAEGGVFSPSNGLGPGRDEGLKLGVSLNGSREDRFGVDERSTGVVISSLLFRRLKVLKDEILLTEAGRSGDRSGDLLSRKFLRSFTLLDCSVCMRLCAPLISDRSGEGCGVSLFEVYDDRG